MSRQRLGLCLSSGALDGEVNAKAPQDRRSPKPGGTALIPLNDVGGIGSIWSFTQHALRCATP